MHVVLVIAHAALIAAVVFAAWFVLGAVFGVAVGKTIKACRKGPGR